MTFFLTLHLRVLENAGLLVRKKVGRSQRCRLDAVPLKSAADWLAHYQSHGENRSNSPAGSEEITASGSPSHASREVGHLPPFSVLTNHSWLALFNLSVKLNPNDLDATFSALADPTRRTILASLAFAESSVTELAAPFNISLPALAKHLRVLQAAGLVERQKHGRINLSRLVATPIQDAAAWVRRYRIFWEKQLDALAEYLEKSKTKD